MKAGILRLAEQDPNVSAMLNPQSAKIRSPGDNISKNSHFSVRCLSLVRPPHPTEMKDIVPCGVMPMRNLMVLCDLYVEYVCALAFRSLGRSMKISKQSIMHAHLENLERNDIGMVIRRISRSGHTTYNGTSLVYATVNTS